MNRKGIIQILFSFLLLWNPFSGTAQSFEIGAKLGTAHYLGDLTPSDIWVSLGETHLSTGLTGRLNLMNWLSFQTSLMHGTISASDANVKNEVGRRQRNLSFRTKILELALTTEINILGYQPIGRRKPFSPYCFIGIAFFQFNPQTEHEGEWIDLQPLGTEGQGLPGYTKKYKRRQLAIPLGFGLKYALSQQWNLGAEFGMRKTSTDYLDDTSDTYPNLSELAQVNGELAAELSWRSDEIDPEATAPIEGTFRGDPTDLDWYIFTNLSLTRNFLSGKKKSKNSKVKCPVF